MKKICGLLLSLCLLAGCYDDKGNYTYKDINKLQIELRQGDRILQQGNQDIVIELGEEVDIQAVVTPSIDDNLDNYEIKWVIDGQTRPEWNTLHLVWESDFITKMDNSLRVEVKDLTTGVVYYGYSRIGINPEFISANSILVLSEASGESRLGFVKFTEFDNETRPNPLPGTGDSEFLAIPTEWTEYFDLFPARNGGKVLGHGPISIREHAVDGGTRGYAVFQQSGAVDINTRTMEEDIIFSTMFEDEQYPAGVDYLTGGNIMNWVDALTDQQGRIFTRVKNSSGLFYSSWFGKDPIEYEGEVLSNCTVWQAPYDVIKSSVIYDGDKGRFMLMFDGESNNHSYNDDDNLQDAGKIVPVPKPAAPPAGWRDLDDFDGCEVIYVSMAAPQGLYNTGRIFIVFRETGTGKYFIQTIDIEKQYNTTAIACVGATVAGLNIDGAIDKVYMTTQGNLSSYIHVFLACGEKLYYLDARNLGNVTYTPDLYFTADSPITSMHIGDFQLKKLHFGTENGWVYQIDTQNAMNKFNVSDQDKLLWKLGGFDKVVSILSNAQ